MKFDIPYSREEFVKFLQVDFLPQDFIQEATPVNITNKTTYIQEAIKLGVCESLDLVVYEVKHSGKHDPRVGLSKESFKLLAQEWQGKALVAFVPMDSDKNYRFSYISIDLDLTEEGKIKKTFSNPRRYSYYLGDGISYYTPNKYLNSGRVKDAKDIQDRFSVEVLTKAFYNELSDWYAWAIKIVRFPNILEDESDDDKYNHEAVIRMVTRLIFVWFLKQKRLIPSEFFDEKYIANNLISNFNPHAYRDLFSKTTDSRYYKAILQNLFFAMLNSPITLEGKDILERQFKSGRSGYDNNKLMRYKDMFSNPDLFVELANKYVPFLNGGLFDCLDDKKNNNYIDGFSEREVVKKALIVPDYLFFGEEVGKDIDLSDFYGDKKKKKVSARGIIDILKRYNFTVEENTPFDQEVSLDPELLGKVFENLLAMYNPETKATARKQTGSFYTPREIVQYMVDESLIAHLKRTVGDELELEYRKLMSYTDDELNLTDNQKRAIINSLHDCKILDPACGSGAFPMGVLQQMVHILSKLDESNKIWKDILLDEATNETRSALKYSSDNERREAVLDIEKSFDENINRPDYARKLYLIEKCIYGVDIQSIAIQISKLRFFISLVIDQKRTDNPKENFGIRPLPNLEAKFVAANTLIGLNKSGGNLFETQEIRDKEEELKTANHKIFGAKTSRTKTKYRERVKELRSELSDMLLELGYVSNDTAQLLKGWDMFDQNANSPFFDPEWMFGVNGGFDVVIGNPPYGAKFNSAEKKYFKDTYKHQDYQPESYLFFIEKGVDLTKDSGLLSYIIPNTWLINLKLKNIRRFIFSDLTLKSISHYRKSVFSAVVDTEVILLQKSKHVNNIVIVNDNISRNETAILRHQQSKWAVLKGEPVNIFASKEIEDLVAKIQSCSITMKDAVDVYAGLVPYEEGKGTPSQTKEMMKSKVYNSDYMVDSSYRKAIRGADITRYANIWAGNRWLKYGANLAAPRKSAIFDSNKIIIRQTGDAIIATYDEDRFVCFKNTHVVNAKDGTNLLYILGMLNSKLVNFYFQYLNPEIGEALAEVKKETVEKLPIKMSDNTQIVEFVDEILKMKKGNNKADTTILEAQIDQMVYALYNLTEEEINIIENK